jgi:hypothetical protein
MQEAMTVVLDYGFNTLKIHSVEANVNPGNAASIKLLKEMVLFVKLITAKIIITTAIFSTPLFILFINPFGR